jgi:putative protease
MEVMELLAPAGSPEALDAAAGEGADAVYLGLKNFNARMRSSNFAYSQLEGALRGLHRMGRRLYVTVNTVFEQREADRVYQLLKYLAALGVDGILVQDFGILTMARKHFPALKLHASTQMNIASARGVNLLSRYGFSRAVLARELSLDEIREIRGNTNLELEVFVHGALCVSVSGLCLFSSYLGGKSANRGMCTQACRRFYRPNEGGGTCPEGGYYFSPADLELLGRIPALAGAGVNSLKIEGRMKSAEYVGTVVRAYRRVIDQLSAGEAALEKALGEAREILRGDFARSKTVFLFDGNREGEFPDWLNPRQSGGTGIPLGRLLKVRGDGEDRRGLIETAVELKAGDSVRLHRADDSERVSHKLAGEEPEKGGGRWISLPGGFNPGDEVYLIQTRAMGKRYGPVIPGNLSGFTRVPGHDRAPPADFPLPGRPPAKGTSSPGPAGGTERAGGREKPGLGEGIYPFVSRIEDLYILQSVRPSRVLLAYNHKTCSRLLGRTPLPFSPGELILTLDPFFPQAREGDLAADLRALLERGYRCFVVNNPGQFSLLRNSEAVLVAGPWLYTFNQYALAFIASLGAEYFISPLENNRQNLERCFPRESRNPAFVTVFSWPSLFRMRTDLRGVYDFKTFSDPRGENFALAASPEGSLVFPEKPFSIVDKIPFLKEARFNRFILDFSARPLNKSDYRDVMDAVKKGAPLPNTVRFNWKDGFFRNDEAVSKAAGAD